MEDLVVGGMKGCNNNKEVFPVNPVSVASWPLANSHPLQSPPPPRETVTSMSF